MQANLGGAGDWEWMVDNLVPVDDAPALTAALRATLRDATTSRAMGAAGRKYILNHCPVTAMLHELEALSWSLAEKAGIG